MSQRNVDDCFQDILAILNVHKKHIIEKLFTDLTKIEKRIPNKTINNINIKTTFQNDLSILKKTPDDQKFSDLLNFLTSIQTHVTIKFSDDFKRHQKQYESLNSLITSIQGSKGTAEDKFEDFIINFRAEGQDVLTERNKRSIFQNPSPKKDIAVTKLNSLINEVRTILDAKKPKV